MFARLEGAHENQMARSKDVRGFQRFAVLCKVPDMDPGRDGMKRYEKIIYTIPDGSEFVIVHEHLKTF